jgi:uncharacterized protein YbaR (Trm112 family)
MQIRKSARHVRAANTRWRADKAQAERDAGIPDRGPEPDCRQPFLLDLTSYGGRRLRIEPRRGYVASRAVDESTGQVLHCAAIKELLHRIADELPRMLAARNYQ